MFAATRRVFVMAPKAMNAITSRSFGVKFMIKSFVDEFTTEEVNVEGEEGQTILEVAQNNGCSINSFCGGNCHCGGCHIKLAQIVTDIIPRPEDKEKEVLKKCIDADESSRLGCQTKVHKCMEGKIIVVPLAL